MLVIKTTEIFDIIYTFVSVIENQIFGVWFCLHYQAIFEL